MNIKSKIPNVGTTVFTTMSQLANEYHAINLGQGFPDFSMDKALIDQVSKAMENGMNQYAPMAGLPILRERLAEKIYNLYDTTVDPGSCITITPGATYAIYTALTTVLQAGDEVIVFEPAYDSYIPNIEINGAVPVLISLQFPTYSIPWEIVKSKITSKTRMIIINSPHNPTGTVLKKEDIIQLKKIVTGTGIFILSDEVYEHIIFDGIPHESILKYPDLLKRAFVCFSFGKTYHSTGWKIGYCVAPAPLMAEFRKVHQYNGFSVHTPSQAGLAIYIENKEAYLQLGNFIQGKRDFFNVLMETTPFKPLSAFGGYFQCYSFQDITEEDDVEFAVRLTKEYGVATIPVSIFYRSGKDDKVIRFCFCKKEETLQRAVERLRKVNSRFSKSG